MRLGGSPNHVPSPSGWRRCAAAGGGGTVAATTGRSELSMALFSVWILTVMRVHNGLGNGMSPIQVTTETLRSDVLDSGHKSKLHAMCDAVTASSVKTGKPTQGQRAGEAQRCRPGACHTPQQ